MGSEEQIAALEAAIGSGERRVKFDGREVEYRSLDEMLRALQVLRGVPASGGVRWRLIPTVVDRNR